MSGPAALAAAFRLALLVALLGGFVLKPALAFADEIREFTTHTTGGSDHHHHDRQHAPAPDDGKSGHDDQHWHLSHCCGQQAAVLPSLDLRLLPPATTSPLPDTAVALVPAPRPALFRPPIVA